MKISFSLLALDFQYNFVLRPSNVPKLVRANQFQVKSTKLCTEQKFVTLTVSMFGGGGGGLWEENATEARQRELSSSTREIDKHHRKFWFFA